LVIGTMEATRAIGMREPTSEMGVSVSLILMRMVASVRTLPIPVRGWSMTTHLLQSSPRVRSFPMTSRIATMTEGEGCLFLLVFFLFAV